VDACTINIYYPQNNTTTDIYYANYFGTNYIHVESNYLNCNPTSMVIIKNQIIADDIITHPEKVYSYLSLLIYTLIFGIIIISIAKVVTQ